MKTSVSDNNKYRGVINRMLQDNTLFNTFKQLPEYTEILEHVSFELGTKYLNVIKRDNPQLINDIDKFRINDLYGSPQKFNYPEIGFISPSTIRYIKVLSDIIKLKIDLNDKDVIEIGVGYGGQGLVLSKHFQFKTYTFVDLKEPLQLTEKYLGLHNVQNVFFKEMNELEMGIKYDFVISNYAFTECSEEIQDMYSEKILKNSTNGYITSNFISDIFNIKSYSKEKLLRIINNSYSIEEEPKTSNNSIILIW